MGLTIKSMRNKQRESMYNCICVLQAKSGTVTMQYNDGDELQLLCRSSSDSVIFSDVATGVTTK